MEIEHLLEQYFEGLTSAEEEAILRRFFTSGDVPESLRMYKPLFVHFDNEIRLSKQAEAIDNKGRRPAFSHFDNEIKQSQTDRPNRHKTLLLWLSGVAACAAILIGSFYFASQPQRCPGTGNYVIIDGRCYTDAATIRSTTLKTLLEISEDDAFLSDDKPADVTNMVESQLKEFDFLLD